MASTSSQHVFEFIGKVDSLQKASKTSADSLTKIEKGTQKLGGAAKTFLAGVGVAAVGAFVASSVNAAREAEEAQNRLEAVFKATGETTGQAAEEAAEYAGELSKLIGVDDETIMAGQALLVTFKNVSSETARSAGVFDRATAAAADLAAAGFGTLEGNAKLLGKALNDPIKGLGALAKNGVTFTEAQKAAITAMVESNDLLGAQKVILGEIETQVGGTAEATASSFDKMTVAVGELQEMLGTALMPVFEEIPGIIEAVTPAFEMFTDGIDVIVDTLTGVEGGLVQAAAAVPILAGALVLLYAHPVVAGLGAVVALIVAIGAASKNERENVQRLTEDLEKLGYAAPETITELIDPKAIEAADRLGVSIGEIGLAINGTDQMADDFVNKTLPDLAANSDGSAVDVLVLTEHVNNLRGDLEKAAEAEGALGDAYHDTASDEQNAITRAGLLGDAQHEAEDATRDHTDAIQKQMDKLRAATDPVFAFRDANRSQRDATREAVKALDEFGIESPQYKKAADELTKANIDVEESALGIAGVDLQRYRNQLIKSNMQAGATRAQATAMADSVVADIERIQDKAEENIDPIDLKVVTTYSTVGSQSGEGHAAAGGHFNQGDVALVGELGPEVVQFGAPGTVFPNNKIPSIGGGMGGGGFTQVIVVNLNQPVVGDRALQDIVVQSITHAQQRGRLPKPDRQDVAPVKRQRSA